MHVAPTLYFLFFVVVVVFFQRHKILTFSINKEIEETNKRNLRITFPSEGKYIKVEFYTFSSSSSSRSVVPSFLVLILRGFSIFPYNSLP